MDEPLRTSEPAVVREPSLCSSPIAALWQLNVYHSYGLRLHHSIFLKANWTTYRSAPLLSVVSWHEVVEVDPYVPNVRRSGPMAEYGMAQTMSSSLVNSDSGHENEDGNKECDTPLSKGPCIQGSRLTAKLSGPSRTISHSPLLGKPKAMLF